MLVINIMDEAERLGMSIDCGLLQQRLGIPVIGASTARRRGLQEIRAQIVSSDFAPARITSYNVCYTKLLREGG